MIKYSEHPIVQQCLLAIEEKLGWGKSSSWHNEVFDELSESIQQATNVLLSPTTLKRVWGRVKYDSAPSISTLNTLAQYAGYSNWRAFKNESSIKEPSKAKISKLNVISAHRRLIFTSAAVLSLLFISLFSMIGLNDPNSSAIDLSKITFSSRPVVQGLPNSVVFDLDLDNIVSDSIYIQQFWDPTKTIKLKPGQKQATGIYYFPGYFRAQLLVDGVSIKEHDLFIKSTGWEGTIDYEPIPKYIVSNEIVDNGMRLPAKNVKEIESSIDPISSTYHMVDDFGDISADNFKLETTLKNTYHDKWAVCQTTRIVLLGTTGAMIIPFSIPGCVSDLGVMLNDVYVNGKENDLSALGVDMSEYIDIEIEVVEKEVVVSVDGEEIYTNSYNSEVGRLIGIRYRFLGAGKVRNLKVTSASGREVIDEDFNSELVP